MTKWTPKRSRSGVDRAPGFVVAPTTKSGGKEIRTGRADCPLPVITDNVPSSSASYRTSSTGEVMR